MHYFDVHTPNFLLKLAKCPALLQIQNRLIHVHKLETILYITKNMLIQPKIYSSYLIGCGGGGGDGLVWRDYVFLCRSGADWWGCLCENTWYALDLDRMADTPSSPAGSFIGVELEIYLYFRVSSAGRLNIIKVACEPLDQVSSFVPPLPT